MMRSQTPTSRASTHGAARSTLPAPRGWAPDAAGPVVPGAHDLARIGVSAPADPSAPIQRVRVRSLSTGDIRRGGGARPRSNSLPLLGDDAQQPVLPLPLLALGNGGAHAQPLAQPSPSSSPSAAPAPSGLNGALAHLAASASSAPAPDSSQRLPPPSMAPLLPPPLALNSASASASHSALAGAARDPSASPPPMSAHQPVSILPSLPPALNPSASALSHDAPSPRPSTPPLVSAHQPSPALQPPPVSILSSPDPIVPAHQTTTTTLPSLVSHSAAASSSGRSVALRNPTHDNEIRPGVGLVNEGPSRSALPSSRSLLLNPGLRSSRYSDAEDEAEVRPADRPSRLPTGQNVADFVTANTPGPITGLSGLGEAVTGALNPPTSNVSPGWANKPYVQALAPHTRAVSAAGGASNIASGVADAVGFVSEARAMHKKGGWSRFWAGLKANFSRSPDSSAEEAERRSEAKRLVVNSAQNLGDLGANQVPSAISNIATATGHAAAPVLGTVAAGAGAGINAAVAGRSWWRSLRAWWHERKLKKLDKGGLSPEVAAAATHHEEQLGKRKRRNVVGAIGATAGAVGGGLLLAGLLGATALTPIGWGLAAAGGLVAAGLGAYKLGRWAYKKYYKGNLGRERERHAQTLHAAINDNAPGHADYDGAKRVLEARGITTDQVRGNEGQAFLKRKAESW